jgi:Polyketide cyclase / dehydrase and lipid transport
MVSLTPYYMDRLSTVVDIDQPPSIVYDFLTDDENKPLWLSNFVRQERIKGADGKVGSVSRQVFRENGRQIALLEEITAARASEFFENKLNHAQIEIRLRNELLPMGANRTQLRVTFEYTPKTLLSSLVFWATRGSIFSRNRKDILKLKTAVEALGEDV